MVGAGEAETGPGLNGQQCLGVPPQDSNRADRSGPRGGTISSAQQIGGCNNVASVITTKPPQTIEFVRQTEPGQYLNLVWKLVPKDFYLNDLGDDAFVALL